MIKTKQQAEKKRKGYQTTSLLKPFFVSRLIYYKVLCACVLLLANFFKAFFNTPQASIF